MSGWRCVDAFAGTGVLGLEAASRGADAVVAVDIDYEVVGSGGSMLMVTVSGTAVKLGF